MKVSIGLSLIVMMLSFSVRAQQGFPYCESFQEGTERDETILGGNAIIQDGVLRLTNAVMDQKGYVYIDIPFSSSFGVKASFEYFSYGGTGADGMTVFLFDGGNPSFSPGAFGGSLGYAMNADSPGLTQAYLGVGFDSFGNFGNNSENKTGGFSSGINQLHPNAIVVRGPGNGYNGYHFITGVKVNEGGAYGLPEDQQFSISSGGPGTRRVEVPEETGYRKVIFKLRPKNGGTGCFLDVEMIFTTENGNPRQITLIDNVDYPYPSPKTLKIGFAGSTGGETNIHEIRNLLVEVADQDNLKKPTTSNIENVGVCMGQENFLEIPEVNYTLPNIDSRVSCLQFFESMDEIMEIETDPCLSGRCHTDDAVLITQEGTFKYSGSGTQFSFVPDPDFTGNRIQVFYTVTDNYGKTSNGSTLLLDVMDKPEPISIMVNQLPLLSKDACPEEEIILSIFSLGENEHYEWFKDGLKIEAESSSSLLVQESGVFHARAISSDGCPLITENITINYPAYPDLEVLSPIYGCQPNLFPDIRGFIADYDTLQFDYQLKNDSGEKFINEDMLTLTEEGVYDLSVKPKSLECWSSPTSIRVILPEEALEASFDYVLNSTGKKEESADGILAIDPIRFMDLSAGNPQRWFWDFGDGNTSEQRSPVHVYGDKGEFLVSLRVENGPDCAACFEFPIIIRRTYRVMFPTGFTPSRSEDKFFMPKMKGIESMELKIFNTWGEFLIEITDLNSPGWDGAINGTPLPPGTYVYRGDFKTNKGELVSRSGKFLLIR
ncbi:PKD domain-containing protein [Cyclobacterium marinum]|uniref:PKD domain-containing protein n=1 Tax=Cyclobacterium marinum TaxID=104 RepID=UPI0011ED2C3D|nr:PKD domain-containing protein [Cyclobacterium marinum]MBI0399921.1 T9SS type B sorting domain-containing protein [Cyclobacterium marinum]